MGSECAPHKMQLAGNQLNWFLSFVLRRRSPLRAQHQIKTQQNPSSQFLWILTHRVCFMAVYASAPFNIYHWVKKITHANAVLKKLSMQCWTEISAASLSRGRFQRALFVQNKLADQEQLFTHKEEKDLTWDFRAVRYLTAITNYCYCCNKMIGCIFYLISW